jgi:hypothetical protein
VRGAAAVRAAFCLGLLAVLSGSTSSAEELAGPAFSGNANTKPPSWQHKPPEFVEVSFCAYGAVIPKGASVTVVPKNPVFRPVVTRVGTVKKLKDGCTLEVTEPIRQDLWLKGDSRRAGVWEYARVLVLAGSWPAARQIARDELRPPELPPGSTLENVRLAVAASGQGSADLVSRSACEDGTRNCEDVDCEEVWRKTSSDWKRDQRRCGDD